MNIIVDTIPHSYEVKEGSLEFRFGLDYGSLLKKNNILILPIQPTFVFGVDGKERGLFKCENKVDILLTTEDEIFKSIYNHVLATLFEFSRFVRTRYAIPASVVYKPPTFYQIQEQFGERIKRFLQP